MKLARLNYYRIFPWTDVCPWHAVGAGSQRELFGASAQSAKCGGRAGVSDLYLALLQTRSTKLSTTRFCPTVSKSIVSLLPSTSTTVPWPSFW